MILTQGLRPLERNTCTLRSKADAEYVREQTGFAIGGVATVGHVGPIEVVIDADLGRHSEIWAAGSPNAVFRLTPDGLALITGGVVIDL